MEPLHPTPLKIIQTCLRMQRRLYQIDVEIFIFTGLPSDTPSLDILAQKIQDEFGFIRNLFNAQIASCPYDLSEFEGKLSELAVEFYQSNLHPVNVQDESGESHESGSGSGSVCESCLNNDASSVYEASDMLYEVVVPPPDPERFECKVGKRWWWSTVAVLTTVSAALMVSFSNYLVSNEREDFLIPT